MSNTRIAHFESHAQAEHARQFLLGKGIHAQIHDAPGVATLWFVPKGKAGVRLEVPASQVQQSACILCDEFVSEDLLQGAIRCPECGSLRVDYPQVTRKSLLTNVIMGLLAECGLLERDYYCEDCHFMWAKPDARPRRVRQHMAPDFFLVDVKLERFPTRDSSGFWPFRRRTFKAAAGSSSPRRHRSLLRLGRKTWAILFCSGIPLLVSSKLLAEGESHPRSPASGPQGQPIYAKTETQLRNAPEKPTYLRDVLPILMGKCARCHNEQTSFLQSWLDYTSAQQKRWEIKRRVWDSFHGSYFKQPMPTANSPESQAMTEEERIIVRDWVESGAACGVHPVYERAQSKTERIETGKRLFATICAACHQPNGLGLPGRFPPLAGSDFLNSDKHRAIHIVVNGLQGEVVVNGQKFNNSMPRFPLTDDDIAAALTYVYNSFGNSGKDVTADEVSLVRKEKSDSTNSGPTTSSRPPEEKSPFE